MVERCTSAPRTHREQAKRLERLIRSSTWFMSVLEAARASRAPNCWVGAGALRDLVWDKMNDGFSPDRVKEVDVAFFYPHDVRRERDLAVEELLGRLLPACDGTPRTRLRRACGTSAASARRSIHC
jgi:hypothetical protein